MKLLNPFTHRLNKDRFSSSLVVKEYVENLVCEHRGVKVFKIYEKHFVYVVGGVIITERAGFKKDRFKGIIDDFLDKTTNHTNTTYHAYESMHEALDLGRELILTNQYSLT